jgi:osmotically inducible lipoprotein OsmB
LGLDDNCIARPFGVTHPRARLLQNDGCGISPSFNRRPGMNTRMLIASFVLSIAAAGCSTYEGMSRAEKGTVIGAGVGALGGAAVSDGGVLGTAAGAAVGGVIGNEVGKRR